MIFSLSAFSEKESRGFSQQKTSESGSEDVELYKKLKNCMFEADSSSSKLSHPISALCLNFILNTFFPQGKDYNLQTEEILELDLCCLQITFSFLKTTILRYFMKNI